jgi:hypothetical protein
MRARKDLKIDFHFILHPDHPAAYADRLDSEIGLLENRVRSVGSRPLRFTVRLTGLVTPCTDKSPSTFH